MDTHDSHVNYMLLNGFLDVSQSFWNLGKCYWVLIKISSPKTSKQLIGSDVVSYNLVNHARNFKSALHFILVHYWNYSPDYSLNCTPLGSTANTQSWLQLNLEDKVLSKDWALISWSKPSLKCLSYNQWNLWIKLI